MSGLLKSTVLGAVLLTGMALAAQAQSVSASPPASGAPQQSANSHPFGPKPSGSHMWKQERYQNPADYVVNPHPFGPKPSGSHMWRQERYQNPADYATNRAYHPYSMSGVGQSQGPYFGSAPQGGVAQPASAGSPQGQKTN